MSDKKMGMPGTLKNVDTNAAIKAACAIVAVGIVAGATLVVGMDRIMKRIFVGEDWPAEEWSNDEWAEEELEG